MRGAKRILKGALFLPAALLVLFVLFEFIGIAANHAASTRQTEQLLELLQANLQQVDILDSYTETGNTSGTGNHVDMLSAVIFRTGADLEEIEQVLQEYGALDEWSFWVKPMAQVSAAREEHPYLYPFLERVAVPEDFEDTWLLYMNTDAPFPNNIEGH
ncbi:hypothetical protein D1646_14720 [Pseudoflavonifractor sp. 60]|uniref:hypothetical protein n=1 Tax=Pseudoflavonifractor sp. 60 TaxID=2304576 RepID=UPI0013721C00|nr:hypothetical protein [Pseudoflavonifractor sp. 60]NBI68032.1 hypothetical protein [Pseudoflavonifractor sp. 60]